MRLLAIHLPHFAVECARRAEAALDLDDSAGPRPIILTRPVGASVIVQRVCPLGRQLGLLAGQTLGQAHAIAPELLAFDEQQQRDRAVLERLADWAQRFSPSVEPRPPDLLLADVTGCERLFRGEDRIARQAVAGLQQQGYTARAAIADTPGAAIAIATAGRETAAVAPSGEGIAWLTPLPPWSLRLDAVTLEQLEVLGLRSIGDLLMLPRTALPARFGRHTVLRLQQALGEVPEPLVPRRVEPPPGAGLRFDGPIEDRPLLWRIAAQLLDELTHKLVRGGLALRVLRCVALHEEAPPTVIDVALSRASRAWTHVRDLLLRQLERADWCEPVAAMRLIAHDTTEWHGQQGDLFEPHDPRGAEALGALLDHLANRLGPDAIARPQLVDDHQPEKAARLVPLRDWPVDADANPHAYASTRKHATPRSPFPVPRPTRLLPRPMPIRVMALVPDGPPTWLRLPDGEHTVAAAEGPERIETGWWRGPDVRRDYFVVTTTTGARYWVFRDATAGEWFLHGVFA